MESALQIMVAVLDQVFISPLHRENNRGGHIPKIVITTQLNQSKENCPLFCNYFFLTLKCLFYV